MGLRMNWLAAETADRAALVERLGFREIGAASDEVGARYACAVLPTGWTVITSADEALDLDGLLSAASVQGAALGCEISETVMVSRLRGYQDGRFAWSAAHDPERGINDLQVDGEPPLQLAEIEARQAACKAEAPDEPVDFMFDAPSLLAETLCGYVTDRPLALDWMLLGSLREGRDAPARPALALRDVIRDDFLPRLSARGWEPGAGRPNWPGGAYDVWRLRDGWFQGMWFDWKDDGRDIYFDVDFGVWRGEHSFTYPFVGGAVRRLRPPFLARIARNFRELARTPAPDERMALVVTRAGEEILAADRFLTDGGLDPRVRLTHGSVEAWRDALQDVRSQ